MFCNHVCEVRICNYDITEDSKFLAKRKSTKRSTFFYKNYNLSRKFTRM